MFNDSCLTRWCRVLGAVSVLALPAIASAQAPPADEREQAQPTMAAEKTAERGRLDRMVRRIKSVGLFSGSPTGLYPEVTTIYPGGWMALGGGYRRPFGDRGAFDANAAWSLKNFKKIDASFALPRMVDGRLAIEIDGRFIDAPSVAFYGRGPDSREEDRSTFGYRPTTVGATAGFTPLEALTFGGGLDYVTIDTVAAFDGPIESLPILATSPGLSAGPRYLRSRGFATVDWRQRPGYTGKGGLYRVELEDYSERSGSPFGFRSLEAEVVQLVPIARDNWVIALRGLATVTDDRAGHEVPFYLMPSIGGNSSVRGYPSFRFRDNHRLLLSAESRWTAARFLDMALFYDTGKVAADVDQLNLRGLKSAVGIGARFHSTKRTVFRLEVAHNDEGTWRLVWSTGAAF